MLVNALVTFLVSFISGVLCIVFMGKLAKRFKVLSGQQVPVVGGSAIWISFCLACAYSLVLHRTFSIEIAGILCASFLMLIFGIIDDWKELSIASKFFFQIIATAVLIVLGVKTQIVYIGIFMNVVVTLLWVIGITNAFNHIDIMDGLAAGVALIVSISFAAVALFNHDYQIFLLAIALSGSIAGFLVFNRLRQRGRRSLYSQFTFAKRTPGD